MALTREVSILVEASPKGTGQKRKALTGGLFVLILMVK